MLDPPLDGGDPWPVLRSNQCRLSASVNQSCWSPARQQMNLKPGALVAGPIYSAQSSRSLVLGPARQSRSKDAEASWTHHPPGRHDARQHAPSMSNKPGRTKAGASSRHVPVSQLTSAN